MGRAQLLMAPLIAVVAVVVFSTLNDATLPVWIITLVLSVAATSWGALGGLVAGTTGSVTGGVAWWPRHPGS
ncbi:hypothetical protein [Streptomyces sp. NPDC005760]|uniref:hypothetical protein n=1 Tax=Streptomyces sp. NPDC005760 TaxID=3156718 RepID=UPI0033F4D4A7